MTHLEAHTQELEEALHLRPVGFSDVSGVGPCKHQRRVQAALNLTPHRYCAVIHAGLQRGCKGKEMCVCVCANKQGAD